MKKLTRNIALFTASTLLLAGCATSNGIKNTDTAAKRMEALENELERSRSQIAGVMTALNNLAKEDADRFDPRVG